MGGVYQPSSGRATVAFFLLPLWKKVAMGGLWPPFFDANADALHRLCEIRTG